MKPWSYLLNVEWNGSAFSQHDRSEISALVLVLRTMVLVLRSVVLVLEYKILVLVLQIWSRLHHCEQTDRQKCHTNIVRHTA